MPSKQRQSEGGPVYVNRFREQDSATVSWVSNIASYYDRPEEEPPVLSKFWRQLKVQSEAEGELPICFVIEPEDANLETVRETLCEVWDKSPSDLTLSLLASYRADTDNGKWVPTYHDTTIPQGESVDICPVLRGS
ncbi:hypothetical protein I350_02508 [Cryptococcus amylolentus CBS 6273]|uniref:Uncharacterized protein n=1 Tax=Cryptococcus amylolentus CBS 6273 TaxID=1296118 RepID=A0A1E3KAZ3_9TREE|nr:hypothetical protein I350_02508 [Cryptococcus amylolentus CBS 6273]